MLFSSDTPRHYFTHPLTHSLTHSLARTSRCPNIALHPTIAQRSLWSGPEDGSVVMKARIHCQFLHQRVPDGSAMRRRHTQRRSPTLGVHCTGRHPAACCLLALSPLFLTPLLFTPLLTLLYSSTHSHSHTHAHVHTCLAAAKSSPLSRLWGP